jgi:hypothetical protein
MRRSVWNHALWLAAVSMSGLYSKSLMPTTASFHAL